MSYARLKLLMAKPDAAPPTGAPVFSVAPSIATGSATPVVGETLVVLDGTITGVVTSITYQWRCAGVNISGATAAFFTVLDAQAAAATRGVIDCAVTAHGPDGSTTAYTSATGIPRRSYPTFADTFGALTPANFGEVVVTGDGNFGPGLLYGRGAAVPTGMTVGAATTGTDAHFSRAALQTPRASATGTAAAFSSGTYVFPLTHTWSDGLSESATLTRTIVPNVATFSNSDGYYQGTTAGNVLLAAGGSAVMSGKAFETAVGSTFSSATLSIQEWALSSDTEIRPADPARPPPMRGLDARGCDNVVFDGFELSGPWPGNGRIYLASSYPAATRCGRVVIRDVDYLGQPAMAGVHYFLRPAAIDECVIEDCHAEWVMGFCNDNSDGSLTGRRNIVRYFYDNGWIVSDGAVSGSTVLLEDNITMSPMRLAGYPTHLDDFQVHGTTLSNAVIDLVRHIFIQADGDAICQGACYFGDTPIPYNIKGYLHASRVNWAVAMYGANNSSIRYVTACQTSSGPVSTASTENDGYNVNGPMIQVDGDAANHIGTNTISDCIIHRSYFTSVPAVKTKWTEGSNVIQLNGSLSALPNWSAYISPDPTTALNNLIYVGRTVDEIVADCRAILAPNSGSVGALDSTGDWRSECYA